MNVFFLNIKDKYDSLPSKAELKKIKQLCSDKLD